MTYGSFYIQGQQTMTPAGVTTSLGPYSLPFTQTTVFETLNFAGASTISVSVPATAGGVAIVPPPSSGVALSIKTLGTDAGLAVSPSLPTILMFDTVTPNVPSNLYITSGASLSVYLQFL